MYEFPYMMRYNSGFLGFGGSFIGIIVFILFCVFVICGIFLLVRLIFYRDTIYHREEERKKEQNNALDVLKERYAKGEIEKKEYEEKKKDLSE